MATEEALLLFGGNIRDERLLRLEIVGDGIQFVFVAALLENRLSLHDSQAVLHAYGMNDGAVHVHRYQVGSEGDVLVVHLSVAIQVGILRIHEEHQRVFRLEGDWVFERAFPRLRYRVFHSGDGVVPLHRPAVSLLCGGETALWCYAIVADAVLTVESPFQRVEFSQSLLVLGKNVARQRISLSCPLGYHRVGYRIQAQAFHFPHAAASSALGNGEHSRQHKEKYVDSFLQDLFCII